MATMGIVYSGAGGMALGGHMAGLKVVWAIDRDPDCVSTFNRNIGGSVLLDVADVRWRDFPSVDVLAFSLPHQKLHNLHERKMPHLAGQMDVYQNAMDAIAALAPQFFMASFDMGLTHFFRERRSGDRSVAIMNRFRKLPYNVSHQIVKFHEMGIPQIRMQVFIAGAHKDNIRYEFPFYVYPDIKPCKSAFLIKLPDDAPNHEVTDPPGNLRRLRVRKGLGDSLDSIRVRYKDRAERDAYDRKMVLDLPAFTMADRGFDAVYRHPFEDRRLTNREMARLQSFPDWFLFDGDVDSVRRQVCQAVPPAGARRLFQPMVDILRSG